jgi:hypothetical protein
MEFSVPVELANLLTAQLPKQSRRLPINAEPQVIITRLIGLSVGMVIVCTTYDAPNPEELTKNTTGDVNSVRTVDCEHFLINLALNGLISR